MQSWSGAAKSRLGPPLPRRTRSTPYFSFSAGEIGSRGPVQRSYKEWENAEFNELGAKLESTLDAAERKAIFARMLDIWEEIDPPGTTLHDLTMFYGKKKSVPWQPYPVESMDFGPANLKAI